MGPAQWSIVAWSGIRDWEYFFLYEAIRFKFSVFIYIYISLPPVVYNSFLVSTFFQQVVDEKVVGGNKKPTKKVAGEVLVRLYGSYT